MLTTLPLAAAVASTNFPLPLDQYPAAVGLWDTLVLRARAEPFNLIATGLFVMAILHTFVASKFRHHAHVLEKKDPDGVVPRVFHFLGEVEVVFGLWAVVLAIMMFALKGWDTVVGYLQGTVNYTEALFVMVIMAMASTRPVLLAAERVLAVLAGLGKGSVAAWWFVLLTVAPLLGSFITEPAAMTIAALLLGRQVYAHKPSPRLAYATLGLLFVNISVGGTLTHFAAPPVLMVAAPWGWDTPFMLAHFGWKAAVGIVIATTLVFFFVRGEFAEMEGRRRAAAAGHATTETASLPAWVTVTHLVFMGWTVMTAHYPALFLAGFLFFIGFTEATVRYQGRWELKTPMLVGFFLAGLVVHGGLQGWWIEPVLGRLGETALFLGALGLTAFNDNAAITYLATLVPNFSDALKVAVVEGAVTGGGLTVIANAPNPAGQSLLQKYFPAGISPLGLFAGAAFPTVVLSLAFRLL